MKYTSSMYTKTLYPIYKNVLYVTLGLLMSLSGTMAQNQAKLDSLNQALEQSSSDEEKIKIYNQLASEYIPGDSALAISNGMRSIELSGQAGYEEGKVDAYYAMGITYRIRGYHTDAKEWLNKARDLSKSLDLKVDYAKATAAIGTILSINGQTEEAIALLDEAKAIFEAEEYKAGLTAIYVELGIMAKNKGDFEQAIDYYNQSLAINLELDRKSGVLKNYNNLANVYARMGDYVKAVEHYLKSIDIAIDLNDKHALAVNYSTIGQVYTQQYDFEKALEYYEKAAPMLDEIGNRVQFALNKVHIGTAYVWLDRKEEALEQFLESLDLSRQLGSKYVEANALHSIGDFYYRNDDFDNAIKYLNMTKVLYGELGLRTQLAQLLLLVGDLCVKNDRLEEAKKNLEEGVKIAEESGFAAARRDALLLIAQVDYGMGNYKKAFEGYVAYKSFFDSLKSDEVTKRLANLEAEFAFQQDRDSIAFEQEKTNLTYESKLRRSRLVNQGAIGGGAMVLVILGLLYRSYLIKQKSNNELKHKNELIALKNDELVNKNEEINGLRQAEQKMAEETLALKERELTTITMLSHEKNTLLEQLGSQIGDLSSKVNDDVIPDLKEIKRTINTNLNQESWSMFVYQFEKVHPAFFSQLKERFPVITQHDLRLSAYLKVGMDNKEIARISNITNEGVKKSINRLKKKMNLGPEDDLRDFLIRL